MGKVKVVLAQRTGDEQRVSLEGLELGYNRLYHIWRYIPFLTWPG